MFEPQHSTPTPRQVPAEPVRRHVEELIAAGYSATAVARLANVETRRVTTLLSGLTERGEPRDPDYPHRVSSKVADAILAIPIPDGLFVQSVGTVRRLRALVRLGHPWTTLDLELHRHGLPSGTAHIVAFDECNLVSAEVADAVAVVFDDLHAFPGRSVESREFGRRHRWAAPLAWAINDDDLAGSIDDPVAEPVGVVPATERERQRADLADFADIVADHRDVGHYDEEIAIAMRISIETLGKRLQRAGLHERRRGSGDHATIPPIYGARFSIRLPWSMTGAAS